MENQEVNLENTLTESMVLDNVSAQSTPSTTRVAELSMADIFNLMKTMSENLSGDINKMNSNFNNKFDIQNKNFDDKFEIQNRKFDEMITQNVKFESNMNKRLNEIDERFSTFKDQIVESINSSCEKKFDEMNKNLEVKLNQILNKKVGDNVISMTNINNVKIVEEVVLTSEDAVSYTHLDVYKRQVHVYLI